MGSRSDDTDNDKTKRPLPSHRLDAERLADEKKAAEDQRVQQARQQAQNQRLAAQQQHQISQQHKQQETKQLLDAKQRDLKQAQEAKRAQDKALEQEQDANIIYSPEGISPEKRPGAPLKPMPAHIKNFIDGLDVDAKKYVHYDDTTGNLTFSGPKGIDALAEYLNQNPTAKIMLVCGESALKFHLTQLKDIGRLDNLVKVKMGDQTITGDDLEKLKKEIDKSRNWPPKPTPGGDSGTGGR